MKIENIVFDLGNVLLRFQPADYLREKYPDEFLRKNLLELVFASREWIELDRGAISSEEAAARIARRNPRFADNIHEVFADWPRMLTPIEGTVDILKRLAAREYGLYVLSNFHQEAFELVRGYSFFQLFNGLVISSYVHSIKPEKAIYEHLLNKYSLQGESTLFIDDSPANVEGARQVGIDAIVFSSPEQLERELDSRGIF